MTATTTTPGRAIEVAGLTKRFGSGAKAVTAVEDLTFRVEPGRVTGFLGPNGAGKTTTLRCLLGLVSPTAGTATIGGVSYAHLHRPATVVGAALEASGFHPGRTARDALRVLCAASGLPGSRAGEVLAQVGLADAADRRVGGFSLGMRQRLSLATALLGEPGVLLLDEPANGLDPEGIAWLRGFLRHLAGQGRAVLVSSHVLAEVAQTVDDVVIVARGRMVRSGPLSALTSDHGLHVRVRTPEPDALAAALRAGGGPDAAPPAQVSRAEDGALLVEGIPAQLVGRAALRAQVELHELVEVRTDLEDVFLALTADAPPGGAPPGQVPPGNVPPSAQTPRSAS